MLVVMRFLLEWHPMIDAKKVLLAGLIYSSYLVIELHCRTVTLLLNNAAMTSIAAKYDYKSTFTYFERLRRKALMCTVRLDDKMKLDGSFPKMFF